MNINSDTAPHPPPLHPVLLFHAAPRLPLHPPPPAPIQTTFTNVIQVGFVHVPSAVNICLSTVHDPAGPVGPVAPVVPAGPVGPVAPTVPLGPVGPVAPVVPAGPVGQVAQTDHVAPVSPFWAIKAHTVVQFIPTHGSVSAEAI